MTQTKAVAGRPRVAEITKPQRRTLEMLQRIIARDTLPPTMRELALALGVSVGTVQDHIAQLTRKGYVLREAGKARTIKVLRSSTEQIAKLIEVPIVGTVSAGIPLLATENIIGHVMVDDSVARGPCFALKVKGDSMINANIRARDVVIVRQQPVAENGDIVVALIDGEAATVKRLSISDDVIQLCAENPKYQPITINPDVEFRIVGKVVGVRSTKP